MWEQDERNQNYENNGSDTYGNTAAGNQGFERNEFSYENGGVHRSESVQPRRVRKGNRKWVRGVKRAGAIALSAVLFGGVAAGTFQTVNYAAGYLYPSTDASDTEDNAQDTASLLKAVSSVDNTSSQGGMDVSSIANAVMPSIVSITNKSVQEVQNYFSIFGYGGQTQPIETESCGSGIIIGKNDSELLIVTNYHVVENADVLSASFIDNQVYEAKLKGTDSQNDLAVIAVPLSNISDSTMSQIAVASIGDSDALQVGEQVVAIGNALGYGQSVTTGIVSATNRSIGGSQNTDQTTADNSNTYIQTDAAINPGNSGGALVNMSGQVVGINSAKLASTEVEGMGYAIPISRVSDIIETLMNETTRSKVAEEQQGNLGITGITVNEEVNRAYGIPVGVFVSEVTSGGAAQTAGISAGEVITKFDGKTITNINELKELLQYYSAGETVTVTLQTQNGSSYTERTVDVTLGFANAQVQ